MNNLEGEIRELLEYDFPWNACLLVIELGLLRIAYLLDVKEVYICVRFSRLEIPLRTLFLSRVFLFQIVISEFACWTVRHYWDERILFAGSGGYLSDVSCCRLQSRKE